VYDLEANMVHRYNTTWTQWYG